MVGKNDTGINLRDNKRVALVHDFLVSHTGAERVLQNIAELFPEAPIYTILYDEKRASDYFKKRDVRTSFLERWPKVLQKKRKFLLPFLATAVEGFDLADFDVVISSSGAWSKGVITKPNALHICYCHTPMRFAWDWTHEYLEEQGVRGFKKIIAVNYLKKLRVWDFLSAKRVDRWVANSKTVQGRIQKYYQAKSTVVYPGINMDRFQGVSKKSDYFLFIGRLSKYKGAEIAVRAFRDLKTEKLIVAGEGSEEKRLKKLATSNIKIKGGVSDEEVVRLMSEARAVIFPCEDDFGIVPVEAMASGTAVIALGRGGARETVVDGKTGLLYPNNTAEDLKKCISRFIKEESVFCPDDCRSQARKFSEKNFKENFVKNLPIRGDE